MTWLPHDKATWGITLAIAAIVLAYPLSVVANLTTPWLKDWWASRSLKSLRNRISKLEARLKILDSIPLIDETQDEILYQLERMRFELKVGIGMALATTSLIGLILVAILQPRDLNYTKRVIFVLATVYVLAVVEGKADKYHQERSPRARNTLKRSITTLEGKVQQRMVRK